MSNQYPGQQNSNMPVSTWQQPSGQYPPPQRAQTYAPQQVGPAYAPPASGWQQPAQPYPPQQTGQPYPPQQTGQPYPPQQAGQPYPPASGWQPNQAYVPQQPTEPQPKTSLSALSDPYWRTVRGGLTTEPFEPQKQKAESLLLKGCVFLGALVILIIYKFCPRVGTIGLIRELTTPVVIIAIAVGIGVHIYKGKTNPNPNSAKLGALKYGLFVFMFALAGLSIFVSGIPVIQDFATGTVTAKAHYVGNNNHESYSRRGGVTHHDVAILQTDDGKKLSFDLGDDMDLENQLAQAGDVNVTYYPHSMVFYSYSK